MSVKMREILFRGKRVDNGVWVEGYYYLHQDGISYIIIHSTGYPSNRYVEVLPETLGQNTGLCDKSGNKVFEHDIVKAFNPLDEISFIGVVKYFDGSFYICDTDFCSYYRWMDYEVEVIGNIYDNPEMLGVK